MDYEDAREEMVRTQLEERGVHDARVLDAMRLVPRHLFVPEIVRPFAYDDRPLEIGEGQTISQPLMVGLMTQLLDLSGTERVLEVGTGSGYQAAVLSMLAAEVFTVERHAELAERARATLETLGYRNVCVLLADGSRGLPPHAPYDRILVTAGAPALPPPLIDQLATGGILVIPIGDSLTQSLVQVRMSADGRIRCTYHGGCVFVPLLGTYGWPVPRGREHE